MMKQKYMKRYKNKFGVDAVRFLKKTDDMVLIQSDIDEVLKSSLFNL